MTHDHDSDRIAYSITMNTEQRYQAVIRKALTDIYSHLEAMLEAVPGNTLDSLDEEHIPIIDAVKAVEEEWVLDVETRKEISLLDDLYE